MNISVVTLGVSDMERAKTFYRTLFDDAEVMDKGGPCYFKLTGTWLALYPLAKLAAYCQVDGAGSGFRGVTLSINLESAEAVDALCDRMRQAGAGVPMPPGRADWGGHIAWIQDSDGHLFELVWNPYLSPS